MKHIPPPLWALAILAALYYLTLIVPATAALPLWQNKIAGVIVMIVGLLGPFIAIPHFFAVGTQVHPTSPTNNKLVVTGLYRFTRNPMYLGLVIFSFGAALWFGRVGMFAAPVLVFAVLNWVHIPFEEAKMRRQFGDSFDAYCKRVRRWI